MKDRGHRWNNWLQCYTDTQ